MRGAIVLALSFALAGCGASAKFEPRIVGAPEAAPDVALAEARGHFRLGNVALALQSFRSALRRMPDSRGAMLGVAACYDRMGRFDVSRRYYEEALALAPEDAAVKHNFALSLRMQGKPDAVAAEGVTVEIAKPLKTNDISPVKTAETGARIERLSLGEVALITRPAATYVRLSRTEVQWRFLDDPVPLRLLNGAGRRGLAARMKTFLEARGWSDARIGDAPTRVRRSAIRYPAGARAAAEKLARQLPFPVLLRESVAARQVELVIAGDALGFDDRLAAPS